MGEEMILWLLKSINKTNMFGQVKYDNQVPWIKVLHMLPQRYTQFMKVDFPLNQVYTEEFVLSDKREKYHLYSKYNGIVARLEDGAPKFKSFLTAFKNAEITNPANADELVPAKFDGQECHPKPAQKTRPKPARFPAHAAASASAPGLEEQVYNLTRELRPLLEHLLQGHDNIERIVGVLKAALPTDSKTLSRDRSAEPAPTGAVLVVESKPSWAQAGREGIY